VTSGAAAAQGLRDKRNATRCSLKNRPEEDTEESGTQGALEDRMDFLDQIEERFSRSPERIAYRHRGRVLTYGQLRDSSDALAVWIQSTLGESREPIAVYGHKEPDMLACFLACSKSGHAYVPIDATVPPERVRHVLAASGTSLLLTPGTFPAGIDAPAVKIHDAAAIQTTIAAHLGQRPDPRRRVRGEDDFYIMFTSGSTGTPKGVRVGTRNVDSFLAWGRDCFPTPQGSRFLNQVPFSFDVSVMDTYNAFSTSGSVWAIDREMAMNPIALFDELVKADPDVWVSTPSFVELCLAHPRLRRESLPSLHTVLLCGEVLTNDCARRLIERFPGLGLYNTYGPTEATVAVTAVRVEPGLIDRHHPLPVGRAKRDCYVGPLDESGARAPEGIRGEIVIEGPSVGNGYFRAPELTANAFYEVVRDGAPVRGYRTGDLGYVQDGLVFYSGRIDAQVKLHGHRIELEDIENNLRAIPHVDNAVVLPKMKDGRCESLLAIVLSKRTDVPEKAAIAEIRAALKQRVPEYMVPQRMVLRTVLPVSVNGKINRKQLAEELTSK
jgi:D-alanine--poly(phosphoribitol) ligase subunit 1